MKIDIIIVYKNRYKKGHEYNFVPPVTGVHLAALTPLNHDIRLFHQQVQQIDLNTDADVIALSFFTGFASEAYSIAAHYRMKNKIVIAGGPHVSFCQEEALEYFDAIITGEAESNWSQIFDDIENNKLKRIYIGVPLENFDIGITPRYDLLPDKYFIKKIIQATRGCPYNCTFCSVPVLNPGFRKRPINSVLRDISYNKFKHWWQRKVVWFWDDNLTIDRQYVKELLRQMIPLKKWWLTQASMDIANDNELLDLMKSSGCIGVFFGIETFGKESLLDANKIQNEVNNYKKAIQKIHSKGISVMAGFITGFDHDTIESYRGFTDILYEIGVDVPFISILTPYKGTKIYDALQNECRILESRNWDYYNGYNVTFKPQNMSPEELLEQHRDIWKKAFSPKQTLIRVIRSIFTLSFGAILLSIFMNGFYCLKRIRGNLPINMAEEHKMKGENDN